jgi:hypothetical protein
MDLVWIWYGFDTALTTYRWLADYLKVFSKFRVNIIATNIEWLADELNTAEIPFSTASPP